MMGSNGKNVNGMVEKEGGVTVTGIKIKIAINLLKIGYILIFCDILFFLFEY